MIILTLLWVILAFLSFGVLGLSYVRIKRAANKPWNIKVDKNYRPRVSIIVPTFNEGRIIGYKIKNLAKLEYQKNLMQIVFVDSNSSDSTVDQIKEFIACNRGNIEAKLIVEGQRRGKSAALNSALKSCDGEIVIISDADCFWPPTILNDAIPYMADPNIGAISGPKKLLNSEDSWVTKSENAYLQMMNLMKEGESKIYSTFLFEGGFSAFKKGILDSFDPYNTGSDDCGTVIAILEKNFRAIMVSEAEFFTVFPRTWTEKLKIKVRRTNQLIRILRKYASLLICGKIKNGKDIIIKNLMIYFLAPFAFLSLLATTSCIIFENPATMIILSVFFIPRVRSILLETSLSYLIILCSIILSIFGKGFVIWKQPEDRSLLKEEVLIEKKLV